MLRPLRGFLSSLVSAGRRKAAPATIVICACLAAHAAAAAPLLARSFQIAGDQARTDVSVVFDRKPDFHWFLLRAPHRLVIDLPATRFGFDPANLAAHGLVTHVRYGQIDAARSRIILAIDDPFEVEAISVAKNGSSPGYRLAVDIVPASEAQFEAALAKQEAIADKAAAADDPPPAPKSAKDKRFTVVLDPGHGGIDSGAVGITGTLEKDITLAFGLELRAALEKSGKYRVFMTRDTDRFLPLDERVKIARQDGADLLISIHADTVSQKSVRGATVYTVSDKASDAVAAETATRENLADDIAGVEPRDADHAVSDILMDLIRRETHAFSIRFARTLIGELSDKVEMVGRPHRSAGFVVLEAPDVPSVLVELGYLSNPKDEAMLRDPKWRAKAIASMCKAIDAFAAAKAGNSG